MSVNGVSVLSPLPVCGHGIKLLLGNYPVTEDLEVLREQTVKGQGANLTSATRKTGGFG